MLCSTAAVRSLAVARAALARSDIPFKDQMYPQPLFLRFEPQKCIQKMWIQNSQLDFVANRILVEAKSFFGDKCVIYWQNLWAGTGGNGVI